MTPTEISSFLGIPATTLSSRLGRLEGRRLIRRRRNPNDGRSFLLEVTALGRRRVEALFPAFRSALEAVAEQLGEQGLREVMEALTRLEDGFRRALSPEPARMLRSGG